MLRRQRAGSVVCRSCGLLVGVNDAECYECGSKNPGLWGFAPLVRVLGDDLGFLRLVMAGCIFLYIATLIVGSGETRAGGMFSLLSPGSTGLFLFGASGAVPVFQYDRWWTLLSAGWLHGGLLHIGFNLMWVRQLAPVTAEIYGAGRMILIYTVATATGFGLSTLTGMYLPFLPGPLRGAMFSVGASAPIFGLLGALVYSGRRGIGSHIGRQARGYAIVLGIFGFIFPAVDNWAHAGGFLGGYLLARWLDPMQPERLNHLAAAAVCIVLTILSIVVSVVDGYRFL